MTDGSRYAFPAFFIVSVFGFSFYLLTGKKADGEAVRPAVSSTRPADSVSSRDAEIVVEEADMKGPPASVPNAPVALEKIVARDRLRVTGGESMGNLHVTCLVGPEDAPHAGEVWTWCELGVCEWLHPASKLEERKVDFGWCERRPR